ncbi:MAG: hypothetical protein HYY34_00225 [Chloroflexi bacterium]|nr:hypothetical protein [Chloroflexota bacterium]
MDALTAPPITEYALTEHALYEITGRNIPSDVVRNVLDRVPAEVVTAYRTSNIEKYRRATP